METTSTNDVPRMTDPRLADPRQIIVTVGPDISTLTQLADWAKMRLGYRPEPAIWAALKAVNPQIKPKRKVTSASAKRVAANKRRRTTYTPQPRYTGRGGGSANIIYPNVTGLGAYDVTGYANVDLGDTFRGGLQGNFSLD